MNGSSKVGRFYHLLFVDYDLLTISFLFTLITLTHNYNTVILKY
jgi:hypothetical protein